VKVLLDDVTSALKNNDVNNAIVHLNLIKQQLSNPTNNSEMYSAAVTTSAKNGALFAPK
jgi:hypothetical protein